MPRGVWSISACVPWGILGERIPSTLQGRYDKAFLQSDVGEKE